VEFKKREKECMWTGGFGGATSGCCVVRGSWGEMVQGGSVFEGDWGGGSRRRKPGGKWNNEENEHYFLGRLEKVIEKNTGKGKEKGNRVPLRSRESHEREKKKSLEENKKT